MTERKSHDSRNIWTIAEVIAVILLFASYGLAYYLYLGYIDMSVYEQTLRDCFIGCNQIYFPGISYFELIFSYMLKVLFFYAGNNFVAAFWLQFTIIIISVFIIYRGIRKIIHPVITVILTAVILGASFLYVIYFMLNPVCIAFVPAALFLYFICFLVRKCIRRKKKYTKADEEVSFDALPVEEEISADEEKREVKLLDNPLPLPKKHVAKIPDYDLRDEDLPDASMKYDIDVPNDDNFDI